MGFQRLRLWWVQGKALAFLLPFFWTGPAFGADVLGQIRSAGVLRVGTTGDYKPFTFRNPDGSYEGADIVMAGRLAAALGVRLEIVPTVWAKMQDDFVDGRFDIAMGGVTVLPARQKIGRFSTVVYVDGKRPVARCADKDVFVSIAAIDRPEVRVVVNPGASNEQFARANFPHAALTVHGDNATVFDEIVARRADVMVTDGIEVDHQAFIHPELCATSVPAAFTKLEKAYWLRDDAAFEAAVDGWLAREIDGGDWHAILEQALRAK